jgi:PAS domain S-box-containing protein
MGGGDVTRLLRLFPPHWPIGLKLFALIISVSLIPLFTGFLLSYQEGKRILLEDGLRHLDALAEQVGRNVETHLDRRIDQARSLAGYLAPGTKEEEQRLAAFLKLHPDLLGAAVVDRNGAARRSAGRWVLDRVVEREFFANALKGSPSVSRPFLEGSLAVQAFAAPLTTQGGDISGVLVFYARAEEFWEVVERVRERGMPKSAVIVSDRLGIRLAHSTRRDLIFQSWAPLPKEEAGAILSRKDLGSDVRIIAATDLTEVQDAVRKPTPPRRLEHRLVIGGNYHSILIPLHRTGWILIHSVPEESVLAPLQELRWKFMIFLALVVGVAILVSLLATWYALRPVRLLAHAAGRVREGDLTAEVALRRRDEIGAFAATFNEMVRKIKADRETILRSLQQIQALKQYYEEIIQEATIVVVLMGTDSRIKQANRKAEEVLGYAPGELAGKTCESLLANDGQFHERLVRMLEERGRIEREEFALRARDGSVKWMLGTFTTLMNPSGELEAAAFCLDVTEERALEEKWERIQKLATVGQLAAGVAHEMKNYLAPIMGYADLLRESGTLSEEGRRGAERIMRGATGLKQLVQQLAGFTRPGEGALRPVSVTAIIEEVLAFLQKDLVRRRIAVEPLLEEVPSALADESGLQQVLLNLFLNALQAMGEGGTLRVRTGSRPDGSIEVAVEDTGPGITEEVRERLFTPFFTTKPADEGTGLGLFLCRQILERMGGWIDVRSRPGEGATFWLRLRPAQETA